MNRITIENAEKLIKSTNGTIFAVTFVKKDGTVRDMNCRLGVTKHLKGGEQAFDPNKEYDLLTVFDLQKKGYRMISLETLQKVTVNGQTFAVIQ